MARKTQRTVLKNEAREIISRVYDFMKAEALNNHAENLTDARWRTAQAAGVSESTVTRILRERRLQAAKETAGAAAIPDKESNKNEEPDSEAEITVPEMEIKNEPAEEWEVPIDPLLYFPPSDNEANTSHSSMIKKETISTPPMKKKQRNRYRK